MADGVAKMLNAFWPMPLSSLMMILQALAGKHRKDRGLGGRFNISTEASAALARLCNEGILVMNWAQGSGTRGCRYWGMELVACLFLGNAGRQVCLCC